MTRCRCICHASPTAIVLAHDPTPCCADARFSDSQLARAALTGDAGDGQHRSAAVLARSSGRVTATLPDVDPRLP